MVGALVISRKVWIFAFFSPYKKNPFQSGPNIKIVKNYIFQHFAQEPECCETCAVHSAICHLNFDLMPACWKFLFKIVGRDARAKSMWWKLPDHFSCQIFATHSEETRCQSVTYRVGPCANTHCSNFVLSDLCRWGRTIIESCIGNMLQTNWAFLKLYRGDHQFVTWRLPGWAICVGSQMLWSGGCDAWHDVICWISLSCCS